MIRDRDWRDTAVDQGWNKDGSSPPGFRIGKEGF